MKIYLGGHLAHYAPDKQARLEIEISGRVPLAAVLEQLGVPAGEVALAVVNGKLIEIAETVVTTQDQVQLYPPLGGG